MPNISFDLARRGYNIARRPSVPADGIAAAERLLKLYGVKLSARMRQHYERLLEAGVENYVPINEYEYIVNPDSREYRS